MNEKQNIKNLTLSELETVFTELGLEGYRARQVRKWLYQKDAAGFDEMTDISKSYQNLLKQHFEIRRLPITFEQISDDGTRKYLLQLDDGAQIESVWIPDKARLRGQSRYSEAKARRTQCISTQVGCGMACDFCLTGMMGFKRNLNLFEITEQIAAVKRALPPGEKITNLVFMGMGEPLANPKNLYPALEILLHEDMFNFSRQHVTVSTSGIAPEIEKFGDKTNVKLAISLNATTDEVRNVVMPINKKFNIERLIEACQKMKRPKRNHITFEYVMLHGVNDTMEDAKRLAKILSRLKAKINLLPFNEFPGSPYKRPSDEWVYQFQKHLLDRGFIAVVRRSRGRDILGACGQLATHKKEFIDPKGFSLRSSEKQIDLPSKLA